MNGSDVDDAALVEEVNTTEELIGGEDEEENEYLLDPSLLTEATLPISNISRLMKKALPKQAKISSSSKELIQSCCIEFISFLTSEANDKCLLEKRKTINGDDILYAMKVLGFEEFEIVCRIWLSRYRMVSGSAEGRCRALPHTMLNVLSTLCRHRKRRIER
jgi:histone H3/H4